MDMQIKFDKVTRASFATRRDRDNNLQVKLSFICEVNVSAVARLTQLLRESCPLYLVVGSEHARLDLHVEAVDLSTGALADEEATAGLKVPVLG